MALPSGELGAPYIAAAKQIARIINELISSGKYTAFFNAIKAFRNGLVYGARIRAPHALVLNLVWSNAPYQVMAYKIFEATKRHSLALGCTGLLFSLLRSLLSWLQGAPRPWHAALAGFVVGGLFWGERNPVTVQMSMYILSRILSAFFFVLAGKYNWKLPDGAFRIYSSILWMIVMPLFLYWGEAMQPSMYSSMKYIYKDNERYTNWYDLICVNRSTSS